jgi:hypothetical protein
VRDSRKGRKPQPKINVSRSLGEAGHEVEELGYEKTPDIGAIEKTSSEKNDDDDTDMIREFVVATPPISPLPRLPHHK